MRRAEVSLENAGVRFMETGLHEPVKAKEALVTTVRFLDREIVPRIESRMESVPTMHDIMEHSLRNTEDGRWLLRIKGDAESFMEDQRRHLEEYLKKSLIGLAQADAEYVKALLVSRLNSRLARMQVIALTVDQRLDAVLEVQAGTKPSEAEDETGMDRAVREAGNRPRMPVDRMMH